MTFFSFSYKIVLTKGVIFLKICPISELSQQKFILSDIISFKKNPEYKNLSVNKRGVNGFLLVEDGKCIYCWEDKEVHMKKGSLIYLPFASTHTLKVLSDEFSFHRIDFSVNTPDGESIIFSDHPLLITEKADESITDLVHRMSRLFLDHSDNFMLTSTLYALFERVLKVTNGKKSTGIQGVINYIERNFAEEIDCNKLVEISFMSKSKMYREFKVQTGLTPIEYKNNIRIERAKIMLESNSYTVDEISDTLGFEYPCYFTRIFTKIVGKCPTEYKKNLQ